MLGTPGRGPRDRSISGCWSKDGTKDVCAGCGVALGWKKKPTIPDLISGFAFRWMPLLKPFWLSNWVSFARVVAHFPQASLLQPAETAADSEVPCVCARPSDPPKLCLSAAPRAWPLIWQSNPSIVFSNSLWDWLPDDRRWSTGALTWTQTWTLQPDLWVL